MDMFQQYAKNDQPIIFISLLLPAMLALVVFVMVTFRKATATSYLRLPPGPRGLPVIGHMHLLGKNPHLSLYLLSKVHGPLMYLHFGSVPVVVVSSPAAARLLLQTHDHVFAYRPHNIVPMHLIGCKNVLFSQPGPYWKRARQICATDLFGSKRLETFRPLIIEEVRSLLRSIAESCTLIDEEKKNVVAVRKTLYSATTSIISRMALGNRLQELTPRSQVDPSCDLVNLLVEAIQLVGEFNVGDYIPGLAWMDLQGCLRRAKAMKPKLDCIWQEIIDGRRSLRGLTSHPDLDFLDVLLSASEERKEFDVRMTDSHVKAILTDVFGAGIDTSAVTVEWALSELLANPVTLKKAQEELEEVVGLSRLVCDSDLQHLPYLKAVVKETMRLHPVAPLLAPHMASQQCNILGFDIPAKTLAFFNVWAIGRDPNIWDKALEFLPERFLDSTMDVRGQHFELLPFGSGRRACAGILLGLKNVHMMLANLLQAFHWTTMQKPNLTEKFGIVMTLAEPLVANATLKIPRKLLEEPNGHV